MQLTMGTSEMQHAYEIWAACVDAHAQHHQQQRLHRHHQITLDYAAQRRL